MTTASSIVINDCDGSVSGTANVQDSDEQTHTPVNFVNQNSHELICLIDDEDKCYFLLSKVKITHHYFVS